MLIRIIRYIKGYVLIRVSGYSPERFMNLCSNHDILIWGLRACPATRDRDEEYWMYMSISGVKRLRPIVKKTKTKIVIEERHGLPFFYINTGNVRCFSPV